VGRKGREVPDNLAALRCSAETLHGEGLFLHSRRVVEPDFATSGDGAQRYEVLIAANAGIGIAGVIHENPRSLSVDISVMANLNGHALARTSPFRFGKINNGPMYLEYDVPRGEIPVREYSEPDVAVLYVIRRGRLMLALITGF
jgi:hypothetical protein